ncbi:MAG: hypothetical protein ACRBN8_44960 [Nannocystales bacterium]
MRDKGEDARREWQEREDEIINQPRLNYMLEPMRLAFIDVDVMVRWTSAPALLRFPWRRRRTLEPIETVSARRPAGSTTLAYRAALEPVM